MSAITASFARQEWAFEFIGKWLDAEGWITEDALLSHGFNALPVPASFESAHIEWLADTILTLGIQDIVAIGFSGVPERERIEVKDLANLSTATALYSVLKAIHQGTRHSYLILTSAMEDFLYLVHKPQAFALITGPQVFTDTLGCPPERLRKDFENWAQTTSAAHPAAQTRLMEIWSRYMLQTPLTLTPIKPNRLN